jgi:PAS domain S-box-containing protein
VTEENMSASRDVALSPERDPALANDALVAEIAERGSAEGAFRTLLDWVPVGVYRTSPEGQILEVSFGLVQMLRYPDAASLMILNARDLYEDPADAVHWHERMQREGSVRRLEVRLRRFDGHPLWVWNSARVVRDDHGAVRYYEGIIKDITDNKMAERALRSLNANLEEQAKAIPQAIHDGAGQCLTLAHIALAEAGRSLGPSARQSLQEVQRHLDGIEEQLRQLAHGLRPRILDDLGLVAALEFLAEGVERRWRIWVTVAATLQRRLPLGVETTLYRVVQEALTNAVKHARAHRVTIQFEQMPRTVCCTIRDDGIGFNVPATLTRAGEQGMGLIGIWDRVETLGGTLQVTSASGRGTELMITIPMAT